MNIASAKCILGDSKNLNLINENISKLENKETTFIYFDLKKGESQNTFDGFIKNGYEQTEFEEKFVSKTEKAKN